MYNKRTWLNPETSYASSNVVAFDGDVMHRSGKSRVTYLAVSDCNVSISLSKNDGDTDDDFIDKMRLLKNEIEEFIKYLDKKNY